MARSGAALFAQYAYPPNELGYCGPADASVLLHGLASPGADAEHQIGRHAREFDGAWPYLEIIASAAGIADPLDSRVVEAYWLGNALLDDVDPVSLVAALQERFVGQAGARWAPGRPHHSFHVFSVYPWVGLLQRDSAAGQALSVLQQCRIRWGEVTGIEGDRLRVRSQPLRYLDGRLDLGPAGEETAAWSIAGTSSLVDNDRRAAALIVPGDQVAMHWDWVCDVLRPEQVTELASRTAAQLAITNARLRPDP